MTRRPSGDSVVRVTMATLIVATLCLLGTPAFAGNLIKGGNFEKPVVPPGGSMTFSTGQTFGHWTVVGAPGAVSVVSGTFTQNGIAFPAKKGKQWVDLTGFNSNSATGVAQTVATTPGVAYTLSFYVGNVVDPNGVFGTTSTVNVLVDGGQVFTATNSMGQGQSKQVWQKFTTTIMATSTQTTIAFINGDPSSDFTNGLDAVKLVPQASNAE
jgi:hypothetical protein